MTTTPTLWLGAFQANIIDGPGGNQAATNEQSNVHVVGLTGGRFLVAWEDFSTVQGGLEPPDVTGRIFDAFGAPMGGQIYLSAAYSDLSQRLPDIAALSNGGFLAAYQTTDAAGANDLENITVEVFDAAGDRIRTDDFRQGFGGPAGVNDTNPTLTAGQEIEIFTPFNTLSNNAIDLTGNEFANRIGGNQGVNRIDGGGGADILFGYGGDDVFVFRKGQANGDAVQDFVGNGGAVGDSFEFIGYGADAAFTIIDATHWQINYNAGASHEVITIANGAAINANDYTVV